MQIWLHPYLCFLPFIPFTTLIISFFGSSNRSLTCHQPCVVWERNCIALRQFGSMTVTLTQSPTPLCVLSRQTGTGRASTLGVLTNMSGWFHPLSSLEHSHKVLVWFQLQLYTAKSQYWLHKAGASPEHWQFKTDNLLMKF